MLIIIIRTLQIIILDGFSHNNCMISPATNHKNFMARYKCMVCPWPCHNAISGPPCHKMVLACMVSLTLLGPPLQPQIDQSMLDIAVNSQVTGCFS